MTISVSVTDDIAPQRPADYLSLQYFNLSVKQYASLQHLFPLNFNFEISKLPLAY